MAEQRLSGLSRNSLRFFSVAKLLEKEELLESMEINFPGSNLRFFSVAKLLEKEELLESMDIGLGFKTRRKAIEGIYIDKKCPFMVNVSIRGRILTRTVNCIKMTRIIIVRRDYLHFAKKYIRYEKRHSNLSAHVSPCFGVKEGDKVINGQCWPLSKVVRLNVLKVISMGAAKGGKREFTPM
ncbi:hypothetical protein L7F22_055783 [Adiantum nelumboides]|nr:hypothetical protein [Adiantum nelumboides]